MVAAQITENVFLMIPNDTLLHISEDDDIEQSYKWTKTQRGNVCLIPKAEIIFNYY